MFLPAGISRISRLPIVFQTLPFLGKPREQKVHKLGKPFALESPKEDPCSPWPSGLFSEDRGGGWGPGLWSLSYPTGRGVI